MARFRKGTTDHDSDGKMGGSLKGDDTMAKTPAKSTKRTTAARKTATKPRVSEEKAAIEAERIARATTSDPRTGGVQIVSDEKPTAAEVRRARKEAVEAQFAAADAKGAPSADELEEVRVQQQVRGF